MIYRTAILSTILLASMGFTIPADAGISNIQVVKGTCSSSSNTAEGPLGSDLTKRQSRFYCDSAAITFFDDYAGHVLIDFSQKESNHSPILGFAGQIETRQPGDDGTMMQVSSVYLGTGEATTASDGWCKLFFKNQQLSGIGCGMEVDESGRRTVAVVSFDATPGQVFQLRPTSDGAINSAPQRPTPPSKSEMGIDGLAGGSTNDTRKEVQTDGRQIDLVVSMTLTNLPGNKIEASTNLPDGTKLQASLQPPLATCRPNCGYVWESNLTVVGGQFTMGPFGSNLGIGTYTLVITSPLADLQPKNVQLVIGAHGEHLKGQFTKAEIVPGVGTTVYLKASIGMVASNAQQNIPVASEPAKPLLNKEQGTVSLPNGNKVETLADGTVWAVLHPLDQLLAIQITDAMPTVSVFRTTIVINLPESDIVNAPQSERIEIEGECQSRTYNIWGVLPYADKNGGGLPDADLATGPEGVVHKVMPGTLIWYVFDTVCKKP